MLWYSGYHGNFLSKSISGLKGVFVPNQKKINRVEIAWSHYLKKRLETLTVAEHARLDSITFILGNRTPLKLCFSRTKLEQYSITLSQSKHNRNFSHDVCAGKTWTFCHFERTRLVRANCQEPQLGVGRYNCFCRGRFYTRVNGNSICPPLLGLLLILTV